MIYLDNAATTFPKPEEVYKALDKANREYGFNSGRGSYKKAREISAIIEETRNKIGKFVNTNKDQVVFKNSATEALNSIIFGLEWNVGDNVYVSPFEHNSILRPLEELKRKFNINIHIIPFDKKTWEIKQELNDMFVLNKPKCIFCSSKSNVTGYRIPFEDLFKLGKKYESINILDASQSFGIDKTITIKYIDFIVFAGHKSLYTSFGIAGFIKKYDKLLNNISFGGTGSDTLNLDMPLEEPSRYEPGSKNSIAIYGLYTSLDWLQNNDVEKHEKMLFSYLYNHIKNEAKIITYLPENIENCSGIMSINIKGYLSDEVGNILDEEYNICIRTGYHCSPLIHDFIDSKDFNGTIRISTNFFNTIDDIDKLVIALKSL